ncbi:MAG: hypothetical protein Q7T01_03190 [bacterium]|nr:hypothetical protein [bacterium]
MEEDNDPALVMPVGDLKPLALVQRSEQRVKTVFTDLRLPDDLVGREFRLTVKYRPSEQQAFTLVSIGGTITGFTVTSEDMQLFISTPMINERRIDALLAAPGHWVGDNDEWDLMCSMPDRETFVACSSFRCHLRILPRRPLDSGGSA